MGVAGSGSASENPDPAWSKRGSYLPPKKPYLTFARKAALVTRKTSTDMGVIFLKGVPPS
jgi:hypothetical protein